MKYRLFSILLIFFLISIIVFQYYYYTDNSKIDFFKIQNSCKTLKKDGLNIQNSFYNQSLKKDLINILKQKYNITEIIALVFYGRTKSVKILLRYLEINLKKNGGILDKVIFAIHTNVTEDLNFIDKFVNENKEFYKTIRYTRPKRKNYFILYAACKDNDIVFKMDDDIVFISNGTFELMIKEYLKREDYILSANVINHSQLSYVHARHRAILPFFEVKPHKWLKADNTSEIDNTVAFNSNYAAFSSWWRNGKMAAVAHESFFFHAYNKSLDVYNFGIWDFNSVGYHERVRVNFIIAWGRHVNKLSESKSISDETHLTMDMPKMLKKHTISLGATLVAHFSYYTQISYLSKTDILQKYDNFSFYYLNWSNTVIPVEKFQLL
jgi:hypothetical protein